MLRINLKEDRPGYALFNAEKWKGSADVEIAIQRNQDNYYFSGNGLWNPEPIWHKVNGLSLDGETLQGSIGPWLIDELVQQVGNVRYMLSVRDTSNSDAGPVRMVGNILSSSAGGDSSRNMEVREHKNPIPEPVVAELVATPEPTLEPIEETQTPAPDAESENKEESESTDVASMPAIPEKKSKLGLIIGLAVLLLAILSATFFFLSRKDSADESKKEVAACSWEANSGDELMFIQACLKTNPEPKQILSIIEEAKAANKCTIAQRLYANRAKGGNVEIALAYAGEYEKGSSCFQADKATAIYWYETALSNDPNNTIAKQKLEELNK